MRRVRWEHEAVEDFATVARLHRADGHRILTALRRLAAENVGDVKKLQGEFDGTWRLRVGDWRVRFGREGDTIVVLAVFNRRDAYD